MKNHIAVILTIIWIGFWAGTLYYSEQHPNSPFNVITITVFCVLILVVIKFTIKIIKWWRSIALL